MQAKQLCSFCLFLVYFSSRLLIISTLNFIFVYFPLLNNNVFHLYAFIVDSFQFIKPQLAWFELEAEELLTAGELIWNDSFK